MLSVCCGIYKTQLHGFGLSYWQKLIKWSLSNWTSSLCAFDSLCFPPKANTLHLLYGLTCRSQYAFMSLLSGVCLLILNWTTEPSCPATFRLMCSLFSVFIPSWKTSVYDAIWNKGSCLPIRHIIKMSFYRILEDVIFSVQQLYDPTFETTPLNQHG